MRPSAAGLAGRFARGLAGGLAGGLALAVTLALLPAAAALAAEAGAPSAPAETPFARADVREVAERIVCYCGCPHLQVSKCFCGTADEIREDVARQLDAGLTADEVVAAYVEEHGTYGLAVPPRSGFNWIIWVGPFALLALGLALVVALGRKWRGQAAELAPAGPVPVLNAEDEERVRAELERSLRALD
jgi:cytochrome c-type biogenesis protein CcmH